MTMPTRTLAQLTAERDAAVERVTASVTGERSNFSRLGDDASAFARKHPLTAIAGAVGLGALTVYLIKGGHLGRTTRIARRLLVSPILGDVAGQLFAGIGGGSSIAPE
jgi:hypothetical protein